MLLAVWPGTHAADGAEPALLSETEAKQTPSKLRSMDSKHPEDEVV
jgi:hypothetical protein